MHPQFHRAVKTGAKLRFALCGPSGSGKTYTLLKLATELGGRVAVIDTERGSASKYADLFEFDVLELDSFDPVNLVRIIDGAAQAGYSVLCIDSLSHFWMGKDGELDKVDRISKAANNNFAGWRQITPIHNALIDKIIGAPLHVLASMRSKTEWIVERDEKTNKNIPRKVGLAPVMRDGIEYEFDVYGEMDQENTLVISKSRCPRLMGAVFQKPGADLAGIIKEWLAGTPAAPGPISATSNAAPVGPAVPQPSQDPEDEPDEEAEIAAAEVQSMWKRMCTPRRVVQEFERLRSLLLEIAGSGGVAEYARVLKQFGVDRPQQFKTSDDAKLCAKRLYEVIEEINRSKNFDDVVGEGQRVNGEDLGGAAHGD